MIFTKEQLSKQLKKLAEKSHPKNGKCTDLDRIHQKADSILLKYIHDKKVTKLFRDIKKWYA